MAVYVLLGPPGAGKGTLAEDLQERFGFAHISTGDILREEVRSGSDLGQRVKSYMGDGSLVPDDVVGEVVAARIGRDDIRRKGALLDGFPRTLGQARLFDRLLKRNDQTIDAVVLLQADEDLLVRRLTSRRVCSECGRVYNMISSPPEKDAVCDHCGGPVEQRGDDTEDTVRERLRIYHSQTEPLARFYSRRDLLIPVDASRHRDEVTEDVCTRLGLET